MPIPSAGPIPDVQLSENITIPFEHTPTNDDAQFDLDQSIALPKGK